MQDKEGEKVAWAGWITVLVTTLLLAMLLVDVGLVVVACFHKPNNWLTATIMAGLIGAYTSFYAIIEMPEWSRSWRRGVQPIAAVILTPATIIAYVMLASAVGWR